MAGRYTLEFDDGQLNNYLLAKPILDSYGIKATFNVCGGLAGQSGFMTWAQIEQLYSEGHQIGAHGYNHVQNREEIVDGVAVGATEALLAREAFTQHGISTTRYCWPGGQKSTDKASYFLDAGFTSCRGGYSRTNANSLIQPSRSSFKDGSNTSYTLTPPWNGWHTLSNYFTVVLS